MQDRKFYVYVHRRKTDGSIFYVGKGAGHRAKARGGRNRYWHNVANKHGWYHEIVFTCLTEKCAHSVERILINALRPSLTNLSDGGEGSSGVIHTEETKEKWRAAKLGRKQSPEHAEKSRTNKIGKKQPASAVESLRARKSKQIISSDGEVFPSASAAARTLSDRVGGYVSQGNISMCALGIRNNAYGLSWSYDTTKTPDFTPTNYREKRILCVGIGWFKSTQSATKWVRQWRGSANNQCITQAARNGSKAYGYNWQYIADDEELPESPEIEKMRRYAA